jgi:hypothetical protein
MAAAIAPGGAAAASIEDAKRIVDRAQPLQCEIVALEARQKRAQAGTEEYDALTAEIGQAKARLKSHYRAQMFDYIEVMKQLPFEERKAVYRYSDEMAGRCEDP